MITVVAQDLTGESWSLEASLDTSVAELKEELQTLTGIKVGSQQLVCNSERLTGVEFLKDLLEEQEILTLSLLKEQLKGVVSGSEDGSIVLWRLDDQTAVRTLRPAQENSAVYCLLPFGTGQLLSGGADQIIQLWDIASGSKLRTFKGHEHLVWCLNHFGDDQFLSGSGDGTVRLWSLHSEEELMCYRGHTDYVRYVLDFSAIVANETGKFLSSSDDRTIKLWDAETCKIIKSWTGHRNFIWQILPVGEGRFLTTSKDMEIREWDVSSDVHIRVFKGHRSGVYCGFRSIDGSLWTGSHDGEIFSWNVDTGELEAKWHPREGVNCIHVICPVSDTTVVCTSGNSVLLLDLASRALLNTFKDVHGEIEQSGIVQGLVVVDLEC